MNPLNPSQLKAALAKGARVVIFAGAGTGKTTTGVYWAYYLIENGTNPSHIVLLTFTRKAADVMKRRLKSLVGEDVTTFAGTYHAFASRLIREDPAGFGFPSSSFSVIDDDDSLSLMRYAFKHVAVAPESLKPGDAKRLLSYLHNTQANINETLESRFGPDEAKDVRAVFAKFAKLKRAAAALDYDDLLLALLNRLRTDEGYAERLRRRFPRVLADEFQDNNPLNFAILSAWNPLQLVVVGDKQQSIYRFRGSSPQLIETFAKDGAEIIQLEDNYRSGLAVLELANDVVRGEEFALTLKPAPGASSVVSAHAFQTSSEMAAALVAGVEKRIRENVKPDEIAVLARSSRSLHAIEFELQRLRIAYRQYGGIAVTDAAEVKDFLAILRFAANPKDKTAAIRAMCLLPGVGKKGAETVVRLDADEDDKIVVPGKARDLVRWAEIINTAPDIGVGGERLLKAVWPVIKANYDTKSSSKNDSETRLEKLESLVDFMQTESLKSLPEFLEIFTLDRGYEKEHPTGHITLSTIHSAKGLEWDVVFVVGCEKASMPHPRAYSDADFAEERRLMYVAVTRARKELALCATAEEDGLFIPSPLLPRTVAWIKSRPGAHA